jgi:hypothetical protein
MMIFARPMNIRAVLCLVTLAGVALTAMSESATAQFLAGNLRRCTDVWKTEFAVGKLNDAKIFVVDEGPGALVLAEIMAHAALYYSGAGYGPPYLQCMEKGSGPYAIIIDGSSLADDDLARYDGPGRGVHKDRVVIRVRPKVIAELAKLTRDMTTEAVNLYTAPHELFHAVVSGYKLFGKRPAPWVDEGMAEAISVLWYKKFSEEFPILGISAYQNETRYFNSALDVPREEEGDPTVAAYGTFLWWQYLARELEHIFSSDDDPPAPSTTVPSNPLSGWAKLVIALPKGGAKSAIDHYLIHRTLEPEEGVRKKIEDMRSLDAWELGYLDQVLAHEFNRAFEATNRTERVKGGLYVVYPKFIARLVSLLESASDDTQESYFEAGCELLLMTDGEPTVTRISLEPVAAHCIAVAFNTESANRALYAIVNGDAGVLKQVHLGFDGNDQKPLPPSPNIPGKRWLLIPHPDAFTIYLSISNVAPLADSTTPLEGLQLVLDYSGKGDGQRP